MPLKTNGGIIGPTNTPTTGAASGRWTTPEQYKWQKNNSWPGQLPVATGGTITNVGGYRIHTFTTSGTFTVNSGVTSVEYLVVAGGGGGGFHYAGGGGAGGFRTGSGLPVGPGNYPVTVGAGGAGMATPSTSGQSNGGPSTFSSITSTGGGKGAAYTDPNPGLKYAQPGGSGGGGDYNLQFEGNGNVPPVSPPQGFPGGARGGPSGTTIAGGGGGAGAGGTSAGSSPGVSGIGGPGTSSSISGSTVTYAGGGGGGSTSNYTGGAGGSGGGGAGRGTPNVYDPSVPAAGQANTGGGAGGAGGNGTWGPGPTNSIVGNGGSGIVIVRYPY